MLTNYKANIPPEGLPLNESFFQNVDNYREATKLINQDLPDE